MDRICAISIKRRSWFMCHEKERKKFLKLSLHGRFLRQFYSSFVPPEKSFPKSGGELSSFNSVPSSSLKENLSFFPRLSLNRSFHIVRTMPCYYFSKKKEEASFSSFNYRAFPLLLLENKRISDNTSGRQMTEKQRKCTRDQRNIYDFHVVKPEK